MIRVQEWGWDRGGEGRRDCTCLCSPQAAATNTSVLPPDNDEACLVCCADVAERGMWGYTWAPAMQQHAYLGVPLSSCSCASVASNCFPSSVGVITCSHTRRTACGLVTVTTTTTESVAAAVAVPQRQKPAAVLPDRTAQRPLE
jgi:hypothetical protein